jgi:hypothetical protein
MNVIERLETGRLGVVIAPMLGAWCGAVLAACGGGGPAATMEPKAVQGAATVPSTYTVLLEGCRRPAFPATHRHRGACTLGRRPAGR